MFNFSQRLFYVVKFKKSFKTIKFLKNCKYCIPQYIPSILEPNRNLKLDNFQAAIPRMVPSVLTVQTFFVYH